MQVSSIPSEARAPGCYASPSVYAQDSEICRGCPAYEDCGQACMDTLKALRDRIDIESLLARHRKARESTTQAAPRQDEPTPDMTRYLPSVKVPQQKVARQAQASPSMQDVSPQDQAIIDSLNKKSSELALKWCKHGMIETIKHDMREGRNPFASQARLDHCAVVCDELLKGSVTRAALKQAFMKRLGAKRAWDETTASAHVGIAMPVLVAFGIAVETPAGFIVNPALRDDNV